MADSNMLSSLSRNALSLQHDLPPEALTIVGLWTTEYAVKLLPISTPLHLKHVCVQTNAIGTSYYERQAQDPIIEENLLGKRFDEATLSRFLKIAALDAVYGNIIRTPDEQHVLQGPAATKAAQRAHLVCDEVRRLAVTRSSTGPVNLVTVGVVGDFLAQLVADPQLSVEATDYYDAIIDSDIHGVVVKDGHHYTLPLVASADIALVTGMTLANDTIDGIFSTARKHGTDLVFFAETGANFAEAYLKAGAVAVISEPFPFYLSGSTTCNINIYRRWDSSQPIA